MRDQAAVDAAIVEFFTKPYGADPYPFYEVLRSVPPFRSSLGPWFVGRHADYQEALCEKRSSKVLDPAPGRRPGAGTLMEGSVVQVDPPDHTRLRNAIKGFFTPKAIRDVLPRIDAIVEELIETRRPEGGMDILHDLALPLTVRLMCDLVGGVPGTLHAVLVESARAAVQARDVVGATATTDESFVQLRERIGALLDEARRNPRDDIMSAIADEASSRLDRTEQISMIIMMLLAGHETTASGIANMVLALLENPGEMAKVRADHGLIRNALEEALRYNGPNQVVGHRLRTLDGFTVGGIEIPPGEIIAPVTGAANRDPAVFAEPDRFVVTRPNANRNVAFAAGIHFCAGAPLARAEMEASLRGTLEKLPPTLRLAGNAPWRTDTRVTRAPTTLPVTW